MSDVAPPPLDPASLAASSNVSGVSTPSSSSAANGQPTIDVLHDALAVLRSAVVDLTEDISGWSGHSLGAMSILDKAGAVVSQIRGCSAITRNLRPWSDADEDKTVEITRDLSHVVDGVLDACVTARPLFKQVKFLGDPVAIAVLRSQKSAVADLVGLLVTLVRDEVVPEAKKLAEGLDSAFVQALGVFEGKTKTEKLASVGE